MNNKEEKVFRDIFNYIPVKTIDGAAEMKDIDILLQKPFLTSTRLP